jgi:hypothetical protein
MTVEVGDILRVVMEYSLPNSSTALNVFYFLVSEFSGSNSDCVQDFVEFAEDEWGPDWDDIASADADIVGIEVDSMNLNGTVKENIGSAAVTVPGTVGGQISASAVSGYIKADTDIPKTRGSKYIPGWTENFLSNSLWDSTAVAKLLALLTTYMLRYTSPTNNNSYNPGVISRLPGTFVEFNETGDVTDVAAYQRRRKLNVGS